MVSQRFTESILVLLIVLMPLGVGSFFPRSMLGISGLNPVNFIWLLAFLITISAILSGQVNPRFREYFSLPVIVLMLLYGIAFFRTFINIHELTTYPTFQPTLLSLLLTNLIKPLQIFLTGWIVLIISQKYRNDRFVYKAVLLSACIYSCVILLVFLENSVSGGSYIEGRRAITLTMGIHTNGIAALGIYFLFFAFMSRNKVNGLLRAAGAGAALLIIMLSFSRMGYLTTLILFVFFYRKLPLKERRLVIAVGILIFIIFSAKIIQRVDWGFAKKGVGSGQAVDAGRIHGIWLPLLPQVEKRPIIGSGLYSMLKSDASRHGLHVNNPHSAYLQVLLDQGLLGLTIMLSVLGSIYFKARRHLPLMGYLILVMLMDGLTGHTFYPQEQNYLWSLGYGLFVFALVQNKKRRRKEMAIDKPTELSHAKT